MEQNPAPNHTKNAAPDSAPNPTPNHAHTQSPTPQEFAALRRRRNWAVFGGIMALAVIFYIMTIIRVGGF